jgi:8-hydroxy-5-deazaflavin:NADPH oxidoreductase
MRIAIIGAGNVGGALAAAAVRAEHDVVISASSSDSAGKAASSTGATAASSNGEAVRDADIVVLAVPHGAVAGIVAELGDALEGTVVVDSTNPLNATYTDLTTTGTSAAETLQQQLPGSAVVKAFNTVFAARLGSPTEGGEPLDVLIAGDDADAKATVGALAGSLGFKVIDAGGLRMARTLEEMAFLNISLNAGNGWAWQSAWKLVGPTEVAR